VLRTPALAGGARGDPRQAESDFAPNMRRMAALDDASLKPMMFQGEIFDNVLCYYKNLTENCWVFKQFMAGSFHV